MEVLIIDSQLKGTFVPLDFFKIYVCLRTFCPSRHFVPPDVWSSGRLVLPDVLTHRTFCPTHIMSPFVFSNRPCVSGCYVAGRFVSRCFVPPDVMSLDVFSGHCMSWSSPARTLSDWRPTNKTWRPQRWEAATCANHIQGQHYRLLKTVAAWLLYVECWEKISFTDKTGYKDDILRWKLQLFLPRRRRHRARSLSTGEATTQMKF